MERDSYRIRIFTWHIHGSYLYYLSQGPFDIYIPKRDKGDEGYIGLGSTFPFGDNVIEVEASDVRNISFDCIVFQTKHNFLYDQFDILSDQQRELPKIFLEHDPPQEIPTDTRHVTIGSDVTVVHVTHFNKLMWDNGRSPVHVIDHGILRPRSTYSGHLQKGIVVINNLNERGRRLGVDVFTEARKRIPLDLIGMETEKVGGLGEILHPDLPEFISQYRFFFNPIRYTSLGLAVLEAMMIGLPVVGLATTEMVTVIENTRTGFIHTNLDYLVERMQELLNDHSLALSIGQRGQKYVTERFSIQRFVNDWHDLLSRLVLTHPSKQAITTREEAAA